MNKILEYQAVDEKLYKLEKTLNSNENKIKMKKSKEKVNECKEKVLIIENEAQKLIREYNDLQKSVEINLKNVEVLKAQNIEELNPNKVKLFISQSDVVGKNLNILQNKATAIQKSIQEQLKEYKKIMQSVKKANEDYAIAKEAYNSEVAKIEPEMNTIKKELEDLQKDLPKDLFDKYQKIRKDNIYPVFSEMKDKKCSSCGMEVPAMSFDLIKSGNCIECEHCRRILFVNK